MRSKFMVFNSVSDFLAMKRLREYVDRDSLQWFGGRTEKEAVAYFQTGAGEEETRAARALVDKIDVEVHEGTRKVWRPDVCGAYPIVADYLAGEPLSMRNRLNEISRLSPIRVVMNISVASGVEPDTIARRGAALAAFAMKLSEQRPVELWISSAFYNEKTRIDVGWRAKLDLPMNVSQVVASFTPSVCRLLNFATLEVLSGATNATTYATYPFVLDRYSAYNSRDRYLRAFREYMNLEPDDVVLDAGILTDGRAIDHNPVQWVKDMLKQYGETEQED
jgi:hypothetical protein